MTAAHATEGGGLAIYPDGLENYLVGALPPPGVHALVYAGAARYDSCAATAANPCCRTSRLMSTYWRRA